MALAFDIHGGRWFTDPEEMLARCMPLLADPDRMRGIGHAALDVLRAEPRTDPDRIAAIGYGTGGAIALELGRDGVELRAIGTVNALTTGRPGEAARIRCPVWAGVGSEDPIMPPAQRDAFTAEMQAAGVDWRLVVYGGALHAFHHPTDVRTDPDRAPRRRLPPAARAASLARRRRPARRVPAPDHESCCHVDRRALIVVALVLGHGRHEPAYLRRTRLRVLNHTGVTEPWKHHETGCRDRSVERLGVGERRASVGRTM